jgi:hypothetical protein
MERRTGRRVEERDCWTRVFRRSAGWRRMEVLRPEKRPARKWKVGWGCFGRGFGLRWGVPTTACVGDWVRPSDIIE